jgi:hypothetical protein
MSERLSSFSKLSKIGEALAELFRAKRNNSPQYAEDDWRSKLEPAAEPIPWIDDALGLWPDGAEYALGCGYEGPGDIGDLSALSELELAEE